MSCCDRFLDHLSLICAFSTGLADVCHSYGVPLIVDEAHGSHFAFDPDFPQVLLSPIFHSSLQQNLHS